MTTLTAKQQQAVTLLASGKSQRQTAKAVGVSPQTITAWMKLDAFQKGLDGLLSTVEAESTQLLRSQRLKAVDALTDLLDSKTPAVKLAAGGSGKANGRTPDVNAGATNAHASHSTTGSASMNPANTASFR